MNWISSRRLRPSLVPLSTIDAFVYATGQSTWLLHDLCRQRYEIQKADAVDTSWPSNGSTIWRRKIRTSNSRQPSLLAARPLPSSSNAGPRINNNPVEHTTISASQPQTSMRHITRPVSLRLVMGIYTSLHQDEYVS